MGYNQLDLTVMSYIAPQVFLKAVAKMDTSLKQNATVITMSTSKKTKIKALPIIDMAKQRPSFFDCQLNYEIGDTLRPTVDLYSSLGRIFLSHPDPKVIGKDYRYIKDNLANGIVLELV